MKGTGAWDLRGVLMKGTCGKHLWKALVESAFKVTYKSAYGKRVQKVPIKLAKEVGSIERFIEPLFGVTCLTKPFLHVCFIETDR